MGTLDLSLDDITHVKQSDNNYVHMANISVESDQMCPHE
jgi:hypothetical protein